MATTAMTGLVVAGAKPAGWTPPSDERQQCCIERLAGYCLKALIVGVQKVVSRDGAAVMAVAVGGEHR